MSKLILSSGETMSTTPASESTPTLLPNPPEIYVREITPNNVTLTDAYDVATLFEWGFRNDIGMLTGRTGIYRFDGDLLAPIRAIRDPRERLDAIVQRAKCFKDRVDMAAVGWYEFMCDKRNRSYLAYDAKEKTPVFLALWTIPEQLVPKYTTWERIQCFFRRLRTKFYSFYMCLTRDKLSVGASDVAIYVNEARRNFGLLTRDDEKEREIVAKTRAKKDVQYPLTLCYDLVACCCTRPGQGYGYQAFRDTLALLESQVRSVIVQNTQVPPQSIVLATDEGERLYSKFGFKTTNYYERDVGEAEPFSLRLMRKTYY